MKPLKVGIVGCGHISKAHIEGWAKVPNADVIGVLDLDPNLASAASERAAGARIHSSLADLLDCVDVVDVCTPPQTHAEIALQVLETGTHLLIEKPLVTDVADWERIREAQARTKANLAVLHNIKFSPAVLEAKNLIDAGKIGRLIRIDRLFLTHPEHDRMLTSERHWSHSLPGGRWFETLPHELYITHFFVGPSELCGVAVRSTPNAPRGAPADEVTLTFANEHCITTVHYSANCRQNQRRITFTGTHGHIVVDVLSGAIAVSTRGEKPYMRGLGLVYLDAAKTLLGAGRDRVRYLGGRISGDTPHARIIQAFAAHLRGEGPHPTPLDEVEYVVRNCEAVGRAIDAQLSGIEAAAAEGHASQRR